MLKASSSPKISIVTPSYNQGEFIEKTIISVAEQDFKDFEHIVIDGGSTDNTVSILKKYPHLKWVSEPDQGQSDALNKGIIMAKADWVIWLNADDLLLPNALSIYNNGLKEYSNTDVIHGHMTFFLDGNESEIYRRQYFTNFSRDKVIFGVVIPPTTGSLFKREFLLRNPLSTEYHYIMDGEWFMRCGRNLKVKVLDEFLVKFRISSTNKTSEQILTGKSNRRQKYEGKMLYNNYVLPEIKNLPTPLQRSAYKFIGFILLNINRIQKLKFYSVQEILKTVIIKSN